VIGVHGCTAYDAQLLERNPHDSSVTRIHRDAGDAAATGSARDAQADAKGMSSDASVQVGDARVDASSSACGDSGVDCCPADPRKWVPGQCGCGVPDVDGDGDGTADCRDGCPLDPKKTAPGICGCGGSDADGDGDGTANCIDACPSDPAKATAGMCGCGVADTDGDGDGVADCVDGCPADPAKAAPGICGCGSPDSDQGAVPSCAGLRDALVHRYRFDGTGTTVTDSRGGQNGKVVNAQLGGAGKLDLAGGTSDQYVDLPNGLVSGLTDATFEVWVTWSGGGSWQRIFDFGDNNNATEGSQGTGRSYLFLTPSVATSMTLRLAYSLNGSGSETQINASAALATGGVHHIAVVFDDTNDRMLLYLDGAPAGSVALTGSLSSIHDINNWLGRSQYFSDSELAGSLHELRIYGAALSAEQIALSAAAGPDPAFLSDL
jgi:hypothetical protein